VTPVITVVRDGQNGNSQDFVGETNFAGAIHTTSNYGTGVTNGVENSPIISQSIPSRNNEVTKYSDTTKLPYNVKINENTPGNIVTNFVQTSGSYSGIYTIIVPNATTLNSNNLNSR
jgi:hypothetical protein